MIDITFDNNEIHVEMTEYNHLGDKNILQEALKDILYKACYSGETITLWRTEGDGKKLIETYHSANKTKF